MKRLLIIGVLLATLLPGAKADVDPNFYIYLCFGQSNMEGNAQPESMDRSNVDERFRLLATCNFSSPARVMGHWYKAIPPLVNPVGGLGPTDYFGRTMVAALPANVRIGVIPVAMGGSPIEMFDKDKYQKKMNDNPNEYWAMLAKQHYGGNPYGRLIEMAKKAQEEGVIKGILLHQGCSNNGDPNWPNMVKKIYNDMLSDLGLSADTVPLFVGETLRKENGGSCYAHNTQVARMPSVVPTSHVVSSEDCPGNGKDPWHFNPLGYRIIGKRYAFEALKLMGRELMAEADYQIPSQQKKFYSAKSLDVPSEVTAVPGDRIPGGITATFEDGHKENVSAYTDFTSEDVVFENGALSPRHEGKGTAEAVYTDFCRNQARGTFHVDVSFFPFKSSFIQKLAGTMKYDEETRALTLSAGGQAGWVYSNGADMSAYKYLVVKLKEPQECDAEVRVLPSTKVSSAGYRDTINSRTTVSIDLNRLKYYNNNSYIDPAKIFMVEFRFKKAGVIYFEDVFLSNDDELYSSVKAVDRTASPADTPVYTLQGIMAGRVEDWGSLPRGVYIVGGKLIRK